MERTIKLKCSDTNQNFFTKSVTFANPDATDYQLKSFAVALNGLTTNTLHQVDKVDTTDITDATNGGE